MDPPDYPEQQGPEVDGDTADTRQHSLESNVSGSVDSVSPIFFSSSYNSRGKRLALQLLNVPPASQASCLICPMQFVVVGRYFIQACL